MEKLGNWKIGKTEKLKNWKRLAVLVLHTQGGVPSHKVGGGGRVPKGYASFARVAWPCRFDARLLVRVITRTPTRKPARFHDNHVFISYNHYIERQA